ncbi:serine/threonine-protein kinase [Streptomyces graminilatus]|uniref:serine/threonine-protein kinase n=1 Tax=Streptomyces graminilatus TaxID=1464070 RepID=UPI0007C82E6F|nr:serine/threonine-protein kinase [Streptomyces graminilatus]
MTGPRVTPAPDGPGANKWAVPGYTPSRELGSGASGRVVLARHDETGSPVAIKYLSERLCGDSAFLDGFRAEARLLGALRSPYVVEFYEYVETSLGAAIVMEPVDGIALRALLKQEGATEPEAALTVLKGSLLGLAAAHAAGVVHRDYKPDNVLIAADGTSKLVDFGIAVPSGEAGNPAGTPVYMAPEQWTGRPASPATDVYAATATFFECLTGAKPYAGETAMELAMQHMEAPIPDALAPEPVRPLIRSGLAKTPGERPASAADFVAELEAVASAAYGEDWEERGQRKLAALAALLLLLFPLADPGGATGTTALATTDLGPDSAPDPSTSTGTGTGTGTGRAIRSRLPLSRKGRALAAMAAGTLLLGGIAVTSVAVGNHPGTKPAAAGSPTTGSPASGSPTAGSPSGSASATTAASAEPSETGPPSASVSAQETTDGPSAGDETPTGADSTAGADGSPGGSSSGGSGSSGSGSTGGGTSGGSAGGSSGASTGGSAGGSSGGGTSTSGGTSGGGTSGGGTAGPSATPAPGLDVVSVTIDASGPLGSGCTMVVSVTVKTDGAADGTLDLSWFTGSSPRAVGTVVATDPVALPKGQTQVSGRYTHSFITPERSPYLGVRVSTSPAADSGDGAFVTIPAPSGCDPPR